ncbi:Hint domain-containing protein [Shimia sp. R9_2]|uniref:Hint domain-containing protein n=1 Tax=Shimia sp. R9_2 TaxID=2821112 RepID=UPI0024689D0B|nr:Hint domain-containing protein [Shimia sp. R9_2]
MPRETFTFDSSNEGWRVYDNNSDSFIGGARFNSFFGGAQHGDNETGPSPWLTTPTDFGGDNSALVGGTVDFSYRNADAQPFTADAPISSIDVMLVANDGTKLFASVSFQPETGTLVKNVSFNLDSATFKTESGGSVTSAQFEAVMSDLAFFGINADARSLSENTLIDNVRFDAPPDGTVDGEQTGEDMGLGYNDETGAEDGGGDIITTGDDRIEGNGGNDTINGDKGNDTIDGGTGDDTIIGGDGADYLSGGEGNDFIDAFGGSQSGFERGGTGGKNADTIFGGAGNDTIRGGFGRGEVIDGGADNDTLTFEFMGTASFVNVDLSQGTYTSGTGDYGTIANVENIRGTFGNDKITGDSNDNVLHGGGNLGQGNDVLSGGAGKDTLIGGQGNDTLSGGAGDDTFALTDLGEHDVVTDFDMSDDDGDGFTNDQLDVSLLTNANSDPVKTTDVVVGDDGNGNALLTFPNGETVLLRGVTPDQLDNGIKLNSIGIPCFTKGTLILTPNGEVPIESLRAGDLVMTRDRGAQPIKWITYTHLDRQTLEANPEWRSVRLPEGYLGNHSPLFVSPQHCMLMPDIAGNPDEAFVRAKHLAQAPGPVRVANGRRQETYFHMLFEHHEVVYGNGAASESFYPGPMARAMLSPESLRSLEDVIPAIRRQPVECAYGARARKLVSKKDVLRHLKRRQKVAKNTPRCVANAA